MNGKPMTIEEHIDLADHHDPLNLPYADSLEEQCEHVPDDWSKNRCILKAAHAGAHVMGTSKYDREAHQVSRAAREKRRADEGRKRAEDSVHADEMTMRLRYTTWLSRDLEVECGMTSAVLDAVAYLPPDATMQQIRVAELRAALAFRVLGADAVREALPAIREQTVAALGADQDDDLAENYGMAGSVLASWTTIRSATKP